MTSYSMQNSEHPRCTIWSNEGNRGNKQKSFETLMFSEYWNLYCRKLWSLLGLPWNLGWIPAFTKQVLWSPDKGQALPTRPAGFPWSLISYDHSIFIIWVFAIHSNYNLVSCSVPQRKPSNSSGYLPRSETRGWAYFVRNKHGECHSDGRLP